MARVVKMDAFRSLAEFRYQIRVYLNGSEQAARRAGLEPQQYLLMLMVRGLPMGRVATIRTLAERMQLRHHTVVELIDRLEEKQFLRRERSSEDRREVVVSLTPRGERVLSRLASSRIAELRTTAPELVRTLSDVIRSAKLRRAGSPGRRRRARRSF